MTNIDHPLMFQALEQLALNLTERSTPDDIRHNLEILTLMAEANRVAHHHGAEFIDRMLSQAPTFGELYTSVMLRSIKEPINNGCEDEED